MVALIAFVLLNAHLDQRVAIDLYWRKFENARLLVALFFAFLSGCGFTLAFVAGGYFRKIAQLSAARRTIRGLQTEVAALRNRSLDEAADLFEQQPANTQAVDAHSN